MKKEEKQQITVYTGRDKHLMGFIATFTRRSSNSPADWSSDLKILKPAHRRRSLEARKEGERRKKERRKETERSEKDSERERGGGGSAAAISRPSIALVNLFPSRFGDVCHVSPIQINTSRPDNGPALSGGSLCFRARGLGLCVSPRA